MVSSSWTDAHVDPGNCLGDHRQRHRGEQHVQSIASPFESWGPLAGAGDPRFSWDAGTNEVAVWLSNAFRGPSRQRGCRAARGLAAA